MTRNAFDDFFIDDEVTQNVDYLSTSWRLENFQVTRRYILHRRTSLPNYHRLENALWRAWNQQKQNLPLYPPRFLQWDKDTDKTWLFGPYKFSITNSPDDGKGFASMSKEPKNLGKKSILLPRPRCQILRSLRDKSAISRQSHMPAHSNRVRFNEEVQQALCLPESIDIYTNFLLHDDAQDSIMTDAEIHNACQILLDHWPGKHTVLPLPSTRLKNTEGFHSSPVISNSTLFMDDDIGELILC